MTRSFPAAYTSTGWAESYIKGACFLRGILFFRLARTAENRLRLNLDFKIRGQLPRKHNIILKLQLTKSSSCFSKCFFRINIYLHLTLKIYFAEKLLFKVFFIRRFRDQPNDFGTCWKKKK